MERRSRRSFLHLKQINQSQTQGENPSFQRNYTRRNTLRTLAGFFGVASALMPATVHTPIYSVATTTDVLSELLPENLVASAELAAVSHTAPIEVPASTQSEKQILLESLNQKPDIVAYAMQQAAKAGLDTQRFVKAMRCESTFNPFARSRDNRYHGLMQYDARTWNEALVFYKEFHRIPDMVWTSMQKDIYDPYFHIDVTVEFIKKVGYSRWPNC